MKTMLDELLEKLTGGDAAAAEEVFVQYEPYLRQVVRRLLPRQLRPKFDSMDIVQSAWSDLLKGFREAGWRFANANQLRAFLATATRNRLIDRLRKQQKLSRCEERLTGNALEQLPSASPNASAHAGSDDLWEHMLDLCPPEHRGILLMKRQGVALDEIAARMGLHPGSIRRILRQLAGRLTSELTLADGATG